MKRYVCYIPFPSTNKTKGLEMNCKSCKYWDNSYNAIFTGKEWGFCNNEKICYSDDYTKEGFDSLVYSDYEEYMAFVSTGKDFGCIHYENKRELSLDGHPR